jgi:hypothetical protein
VDHNVVADTPLPEFLTTGALAPGGVRLFAMNTIGVTGIHCSIHANAWHVHRLGTLNATLLGVATTPADVHVQLLGWKIPQQVQSR